MSTALPNLPGFALESALKRLGNNRERLETILIKFAHSSRDAASEITLLCATGKIEDALRRAHQLNGSAANLGAEALSAVAFKIEQEFIKGETAAPSALLEQLKDQLKALEHCVTEIKKQRSERPATSPIDSELLALVQNIKAKIQFDLAQSYVLIDKLTALCENTPHQGFASHIDALFTEFELAALEKALDEYIQTHNAHV